MSTIVPGFPIADPDPEEEERKRRDAEHRARILPMPKPRPSWDEEVDALLEARRVKLGLPKMGEVMGNLPPRDNDVTMAPGPKRDLLTYTAEDESAYRAANLKPAPVPLGSRYKPNPPPPPPEPEPSWLDKYDVSAQRRAQMAPIYAEWEAQAAEREKVAKEAAEKQAVVEAEQRSAAEALPFGVDEQKEHADTLYDTLAKQSGLYEGDRPNPQLWAEQDAARAELEGSPATRELFEQRQSEEHTKAVNENLKGLGMFAAGISPFVFGPAGAAAARGIAPRVAGEALASASPVPMASPYDVADIARAVAPAVAGKAVVGGVASEAAQAAPKASVPVTLPGNVVVPEAAQAAPNLIPGFPSEPDSPPRVDAGALPPGVPDRRAEVKAEADRLLAAGALSKERIPKPPPVSPPGVPVIPDAPPVAPAPEPPMRAEPPGPRQPHLYHGTRSTFDKFATDESGRQDPTALYGPGVYLTDDMAVAEGYSRTKRVRKGETPTPAVLRVNTPADAKLIDLEKPLPTEAIDALRSVGFLEVKGAIEGNPATGRAFYEALKDEMSGGMLSTTEAGEILDSVNYTLRQAGFDGLSHVGGSKTGGKKHNVTILFDAGKAQIAGRDVPRQPHLEVKPAEAAATAPIELIPPDRTPVGGSQAGAIVDRYVDAENAVQVAHERYTRNEIGAGEMNRAAAEARRLEDEVLGAPGGRALYEEAWRRIDRDHAASVSSSVVKTPIVPPGVPKVDAPAAQSAPVLPPAVPRADAPVGEGVKVEGKAKAGRLLPGEAGAVINPAEAVRQVAKSIDEAFARPQAYQSALPESVQAPLKALRDAKEPPPSSRPGSGIIASVEEFMDAYSSVKKEPSIGIVDAGPSGIKLSLQDDAKALVHQIDRVQREKSKLIEEYDRLLQKPGDNELVGEYLALKDIEQQIIEDADLPLDERKAVPAGFTADTVAANLAELESALDANPNTREAVEVMRQIDDMAGDIFNEVYGMEKRENHFRRYHIFDEPADKTATGKPSKVAVPFSGSIQKRKGSARPFVIDPREVAARQLDEALRAKTIHNFVKKLEASPNNVLNEVLETGDMPKGYVLWSPKGGPTLEGLRASRNPALKAFAESAAEGVLEGILESGNREIAQAHLNVYSRGKTVPYLAVKPEVAKMLDAFTKSPEEVSALQAIKKAATTLFKATVLVPAKGVAYLRRNAISDIVNGTLQAVDTGPFSVTAAKAAGRLVSFPIRRAKEVVTGKLDSVLESARDAGALESGYFGSAGPMKPMGSMFRTGQSAPPAPFRTLTPGQKAARTAEVAALGLPRLVSEVTRLLEAGPRSALIEYLEKTKGMNRDAAIVKGNQAMVDYRTISANQQLAREALAPFVTWTAGTEANFIKAPVAAGGSWKARQARVIGRMAPLITAYLTWNYYLHGEQEDSLAPEVRSRAHLNMGWDEKTKTWVTIDLGVDLPLSHKALTAAGLYTSSLFADDHMEAFDRRALGKAFARDVTKTPFGLLGPFPQAGVIAATGVSPYDERAALNNFDRKAPFEVRQERTRQKLGFALPDPVARALGPDVAARAAAGVSPFLSPLRTVERATREDDPALASRTTRSYLLGDPRSYHQPGTKNFLLQRGFKDELLEAYAEARERKDVPEKHRIWALLKDMRVTPEQRDRYLIDRKRERKRSKDKPEERTKDFNKRFAPKGLP